MRLTALFFLALYASLWAYSFSHGSQWVFDHTSAMLFLGVMYAARSWLHLTTASFVLFNIALLTHNLGAFGLYQLDTGVFAYDNIVHFISSAVAAWITFSFVTAKLRLRQNASLADHRLVFVLLTVALVTLFGISVELNEYAGSILFGEGDGLFLVGDGDYNAADQYADTMQDIITNIIGSLVGVATYYHLRYRRLLQKRLKRKA